MSNLKVETNIEKDKMCGTVIIIVTNDLKNDVISLLSKFFELEILSAEIKSTNEKTCIKIETKNMDRMEIINSGLQRQFRVIAGIDNIGTN